MMFWTWQSGTNLSLPVWVSQQEVTQAVKTVNPSTAVRARLLTSRSYFGLSELESGCVSAEVTEIREGNF